MNRLSNFVLAAAATLLPFAAQPLTAQAAAPAPAATPAVAATPVPADFRPTRFFTHVEGSGPDVIMIPGLGCSKDVWKDEAAHLTAHYRVHLVQIRGFAGYPPPKDATGPMLQTIVTELAQYIEVLKLDKPAIIGHSMGGLIGLMLAAEHPQDVGKLMIVDAYPYYGGQMDPSASPDQIKAEAGDIRRSWLDEPASTFLHEQNAMTASLVKNADKRAEVVLWTVNSDRHTFVTAAFEDITTDARPQLPKIEAPITVLYAFDAGKRSQKDVDKQAHDAYATAPQVTLIRIDDSAHFIMLDQPQKFDEAVQKFLKS